MDDTAGHYLRLIFEMTWFWHLLLCRVLQSDSLAVPWGEQEPEEVLGWVCQLSVWRLTPLRELCYGNSENQALQSPESKRPGFFQHSFLMY